MQYSRHTRTARMSEEVMDLDHVPRRAGPCKELTTERDTLLRDIGMSEDELLRSGEGWTMATEKQWRRSAA